MGKFDLSKFDGVLGIGFLGGAISCFIVYIVCNIVANFPATLPEVTQGILQIAFYTVITGAIILALGTSLIIINAIKTRRLESEGTPTSHVLFVVCLTTVILVVSLIIPALIF